MGLGVELPLVYDNPQTGGQKCLGLVCNLNTLFCSFHVRLPLARVAHFAHLYFVSCNAFVIYHTCIRFSWAIKSLKAPGSHGFAPDPTGELTMLWRLLSWWVGPHCPPPQETHPALGPVDLRVSKQPPLLFWQIEPCLPWIYSIVIILFISSYHLFFAWH